MNYFPEENPIFVLFVLEKNPIFVLFFGVAMSYFPIFHGSHWDWKSGKTWKNGKAFSSQGKVREFCQDWKSQGILPKILEKQENLNKKNVFCESQGILHKMLENQWI